MQILCDKPSVLENALNDGTHVHYSPALDVYSESNSILQTLKGLYVSSKLDFEDEDLIDYIKSCAKPSVDVVPHCHVCKNIDDFREFYNKYLKSYKDLRIAYDVETTAAFYLSKNYKLAGFSLANCVEEGCYVILDSIDYRNPDYDLCINFLEEIIKNHKILVFNSQHEYIASKICINDIDLIKDSVHLDDAYAMALTMKTESFKADVFKLKLLCHRLLGTENWATIVDDYIKIAMDIASDYVEEYDFNNLDELQQEKFDLFCNILKDYDYTVDDCKIFVQKLRETYPVWKGQDVLPYSLIPSRLVSVYGCYDACYLVALFDFFLDWANDLQEKLSGQTLNEPNVMGAYENCVRSQIMSAILTINGIFISEERDEEVKSKSASEAEKYYNKLWEVKSDVTGESILREFVINDKAQREKLEKNYLLPKYLIKLIPKGFEFVTTTSTFYSFTVRKTTTDVDEWLESEGLKPINAAKNPNEYKILQKHLLPYSVLDDEDKLLYGELDKYFEDMTKKDGTLSKTVFKPMSSPKALLDIITRELKYSNFMERVVLYEYDNLPDNKKDDVTTLFLKNNNIYDFDGENKQSYINMAKSIREKVMTYLSKQYSYKDTYENLTKNGIHSFSSPIIAYIYNIYTATGCSFDNPKYAAFDFICKLKTCRKYQRIISTFIAGSSGGYSSQKFVYNDSVSKSHLVTSDLPVANAEDNKSMNPLPEGTSRAVFGSWYANTAETGRWQATVHNVPAGAFCKRRFVSRFKGGFILANDMSQMEVRELAAISKCEKLLEVIKDPSIDIHKRTASLAFNVPYDEVTSTQRKQTKTGIFSVVYGREEQSLAQELFNGDHAAAKRLMDSIFRVYPEINIYLENVLDDARKYGYIVTRQGCPIFVNPVVQAGTSKTEGAFIRNTRNYCIQGGASMGACTGTLVNIQKLFDKNNLKSKIICYIHDSIEVDCHPDEFDAVFRIMNYAFNELATKQFEVSTNSDTVCGISMGEELDIKRLEKNHYLIEGNAPDIEDVLNQFKLNYNVEILKDELSEVKYMGDDVSWVFISRSELRYYDQKQNRKTEFKITKK